MRLPLDPEGWLFSLPPAAVGAGFLCLGLASEATARSPWTWGGGLLVALALGVLLFFRDPERRPEPIRGTESLSDVLLSPADGRVVRVGEPPSSREEAPEGSSSALSIFLSLFDIHVNRSPADGEVRDISYRSGGFQAAFRDTASEANERNQLTLATRRGTVVLRQVAGLVARRIVCRVREGQEVTQGQRIGLIRFGSRVDLFVDAGWEWTVGVGDRVRGGSTVVARRREPEAGGPPPGEAAP